MLKESLEKLDKYVMNLLTYSVKFVQPSIEFVSNNQGYKQKKTSTNSHQNKRKEGNICIVGCELFYRLWPQEEDELLSSYSFAWLLTGDFRLAKGDVKRISFFHVNGRFVRYLTPFCSTEIWSCVIHHVIPNVHWFGTQAQRSGFCYRASEFCS